MGWKKMLGGAAAGFLVGGPVGAVVGAAAGKILSKNERNQPDLQEAPDQLDSSTPNNNPENIGTNISGEEHSVNSNAKSENTASDAGRILSRNLRTTEMQAAKPIPSIIDLSGVCNTYRGSQDLFVDNSISEKHFCNIQKGAKIDINACGLGRMRIFIDTTLWGGGKEGIAFCDNGVLWHELLTDGKYALYENIQHISIKDYDVQCSNIPGGHANFPDKESARKILLDLIRYMDQKEIDDNVKNGDIQHAIDLLSKTDQYPQMVVYAEKMIQSQDGSTPDAARVEALLTAAVRVKNIQAILTLGKLKYYGKIVLQDYDQALQLLSPLQIPEAMELVADMYLCGHGTKRDVLKAESLFQKIAVKSRLAQNKLNEIQAERKKLFNEAIKLKNAGQYKNALEKFQESAEIGYANGAVEAAHLLMGNDDASLKNIPMAVAFYEQNLDLIGNLGLKNLAGVYATGLEGVPANTTKAIKLYLKADSLGEEDYADSIIALAKQTNNEKLEWTFLCKKAERGDWTSASTIAQKFDEQQQLEKALHYYQLIADSNSDKSAETAGIVANRFENGIGCQADLNMALKYYQKAESLHQSKIYLAIAKLMLKHSESDADTTQGLHYLELAHTEDQHMELEELIRAVQSPFAFYDAVQLVATSKPWNSFLSQYSADAFCAILLLFAAQERKDHTEATKIAEAILQMLYSSQEFKTTPVHYMFEYAQNIETHDESKALFFELLKFCRKFGKNYKYLRDILDMIECYVDQKFEDREEFAQEILDFIDASKNDALNSISDAVERAWAVLNIKIHIANIRIQDVQFSAAEVCDWIAVQLSKRGIAFETTDLSDGKIVQLKIFAGERPVILTFHERVVLTDIELLPYEQQIAEKINRLYLSDLDMKLFFSCDVQTGKEQMFFRHTCKYYDFLDIAGLDGYHKAHGKAVWIDRLCNSYQKEIQEYCDKIRDNIQQDYTGKINFENINSFRGEFTDEGWEYLQKEIQWGQDDSAFAVVEEKLNKKLDHNSWVESKKLGFLLCQYNGTTNNARQMLDDFLSEFKHGNQIEWEIEKDKNDPGSKFPYIIQGDLLREGCPTPLRFIVSKGMCDNLVCWVACGCSYSRQIADKIKFFQQFCFSKVSLDKQKQTLSFYFSTRIGRALTPSIVRDLIMTPVNELCTWGRIATDESVSYLHPKELRQYSFAEPSVRKLFKEPFFYLDSEMELMKIVQELERTQQELDVDSVLVANMPPEIYNFIFRMQQTQSLSQTETEYYFY